MNGWQKVPPPAHYLLAAPQPLVERLRAHSKRKTRSRTEIGRASYLQLLTAEMNIRIESTGKNPSTLLFSQLLQELLQDSANGR
jgi:hypothetical protein